jgi:single-stranded-DNA-specific exonuclease
VRQGLRNLRAGARPAFAALASVAGIDVRRIGSTDVAFAIVPRLNAAGRLGDGKTALGLLLCDDIERCHGLAALLETHNVRRRDLLARVVDGAIAAVDAGGFAGRGEPIVLASQDWHPGVVGIAASRIAEAYGVPAILLASDGRIARGSGRAADGVDLLEMLRDASARLQAFGGHRSAVGLTIEVGEIPSFREEILRAARKNPPPTRVDRETLEVDARAEPGEIDMRLLDWLDRFEPFGRGNPEPVLAVRGRMAGEVRVLKERHLRFDLAGPGGGRLECIGFGLGDAASRLSASAGEVHAAGVVTRNSFRGEERVQFQVRDIAFVDPFGNG